MADQVTVAVTQEWGVDLDEFAERIGVTLCPFRATSADVAQRHPCYGYRRIWALLRREGWGVNRKRVQRLWRTAQLQVPTCRLRRPALSTAW